MKGKQEILYDDYYDREREENARQELFDTNAEDEGWVCVEDVPDDGDSVIPLGAIYVNRPSEPSFAQERIGQTILIIGGSNHKYVLSGRGVNARLHGHVFFGVAVPSVFVGEFVHVVEKHDTWRVGSRLLEGFLDGVDEFPVGLVLAQGKHVSSACLDQTIRHQCFADAGLPDKQDPSGHGDAQPRILFSIPHHVGKNSEFVFDTLISYNFVKCVHLFLLFHNLFVFPVPLVKSQAT